MRQVDDKLKVHLATGTTTLCTCWIVRRGNGAALGFTDHDENLSVTNVPCAATSGFNTTEAVRSLGLAADTQDIEGALQSDAITPEDIAAGLYDDAQVEVWTVNWSDPAQAFHLRTMIVGEIARDAQTFRVELRGLTALLDRVQGRSYGRTCDAVVGDARCKVDLSGPAFATSGTAQAMSDLKTLVATLTGTHGNKWFDGGALLWTTGANAGLKTRATSVTDSNPATIVLEQPPARPVVEGDQFTLQAGCDQTFATCRTKFANHLNFRGHPHIPGTQKALAYAVRDGLHNGEPLVR